MASAWISVPCFQPMPVSPGPSDSRVLASATPPELFSAANILPVPRTATAAPQKVTLDKSRPGSQPWGGRLNLSESPFPGLCDQLGTAAALAMPMQDQLDALPSSLSTNGCWGGGLPAGTGAAWPFPRSSGAQAVLQGSNRLGAGGQSIPSMGQPHSPNSQWQVPRTCGSPKAAGPAPAPSPRQHPPHAAFYGPAAAAVQTWAAGTAELGASPGLALRSPRDAPDGPPAWAAALGEPGLSGKVPRAGSTPLIWGVPKHPAALHPCPSAPDSPHPCLEQPRIPASCSTLCQSTGVHGVTSHLPVVSSPPCKPDGPRSPAVPQTSTAQLAPSRGRDTIPVLLTALQGNELPKGSETRNRPARPALGTLLPPGTQAGLAGNLRLGELGSPLEERVCPAEGHGVCRKPNDSTVPTVSPPQERAPAR